MQRTSKHSGPVGFGVFFVIVGSALLAFGCFRHIPPLVRTDGIIVDSVPTSNGSTRRTISYDYTAGGVRHHGQCYIFGLRRLLVGAGVFDVGHKFPVYYDPKRPEDAYAPNKPMMTTAIVVGIMGILFGGAIIKAAW